MWLLLRTYSQFFNRRTLTYAPLVDIKTLLEVEPGLPAYGPDKQKDLLVQQVESYLTETAPHTWSIDGLLDHLRDEYLAATISTFIEHEKRFAEHHLLRFVKSLKSNEPPPPNVDYVCAGVLFVTNTDAAEVTSRGRT